MTVNPDMHVGDWGTTFEMTIMRRDTNKPLSLAGTETRLFLFQPPGEGAESFVKTATISNGTGTDGKLKYIFEEGDIEVPGDWEVQALVLGPDGQWHTDITTFTVGENIATPSS